MLPTQIMKGKHYDEFRNKGKTMTESMEHILAHYISRSHPAMIILMMLKT